jgi:Holliday junction DNA helicase RuvB
LVNRLDFYSAKELGRIIQNCAEVLKIAIDGSGSAEIARRSRGTPRIANRLLKRVRDFAQVKADGAVTTGVAKLALNNLEIDELGLDKLDRKILSTIIEKFGGGTVGVETLSAAISEESQTVEDVYEPYLMQIGYIERTPRGRMATESAYEHLGKKPKDVKQKRLFE